MMNNIITRKEFQAEARKLYEEYAEKGIRIIITDFSNVALAELIWNPTLYKTKEYKKALKDIAKWKYNGYTIVE